MDTDEEGEDTSSRPRSPSRRRRRDDDDDDDDAGVSGDGRHPIGEDLSHRIVELRTPTTESDDARPSTSGLNLVRTPAVPLLSSSDYYRPDDHNNGLITVNRSLGVVRSRAPSSPDEPPLLRRRLNPNDDPPRLHSRNALSRLARRVNERSRIDSASSSRRVDAGHSSSRFTVESLPEDELDLPSSAYSHHRNVQARRRLNDCGVGEGRADGEGSNGGGAGDGQRGSGGGTSGREDPSRRRDPREEVDDEPLIILDPYGMDGSEQPIGAPLDLRRELVSDAPAPSDRNLPGLGRPGSGDGDGAPGGGVEGEAVVEGGRVQMQVFQEEVDDDEEEEEVETVEDSAPEDEGDPPPGGAEVTDDESDDEDDDVESDAATAGSSISESRERALSVALHPLRVPSPSLRPVPASRPPISCNPAIPSVAAPTFPSFAPAATPAFAQSSGGVANDASSRTDRDAMPPPAPALNVPAGDCSVTTAREDTASPGRFEEKLSHTNHCPHMLTGLWGLRQEGVLCDFTLIADGQRFPVHKIVLCACSDYFRAMFTQNLAESRAESVELHGVTSGGLRALLNFIYTGELVVSLDSVAEIVGAATHLQVLEVSRMCSTYLKRHLGLDNCVDVLGLAELYSLHRLKDHALQFLCQNLQEFISEENADGNVQQLHRLTHDQLQVILRSDSLQVSREVEVFQVAVKWLKHSWEDRQSFAASLMECVRFPLLTGEELVDVVEKEEFMSSDPACHRLILEAYQYAILPNRQHLMQTMRTQVRASPSLVVLGGPWDFVPIFPFPLSSSRSCASNRSLGVNHLQWHQGQNTMVYKTNGAGVTTLDNYIFLIGGQISQEDRTKSGACFRYDPRTNKWLTLRSMNRARAFLAVVTKDKRIYAIGGQGRGSRPKSSCEVYDSVSGEWSPIATLPQYALLASACNYRNTIYVSGGHPDAGILKLTGENTWEHVAALPEARYRHTMLGAGNSLYIIGGRAIKHVGGRRQYPVPNTIVSYNLDTSSWSSFSLQPGPSTPLDPAAGPPPFDQALINGNRMTLFSHPLLKAFHVNSSLYVVTKDSIYRSSNFPSPNGFGKWKYVAANPQTFTADMAFCLAPLPQSSFLENGSVTAGSSGSHLPQSYASLASPFWSGRGGGGGGGLRNTLRNQLVGGGPGLPGGPDAGHRARSNRGAPDGNDEEILINWEILEG